ncbi:MAG: hypothetical protein V4724_36685 [Pseudomonadota bacterium]
MNHAVYCLARDQAHVETIIESLKRQGFARGDISVLFPDQGASRDFAHEQHTKLPEGAATGGVAGMGAGAIMGWLAGIGTLALPGLGPFVAAGPIMAALSGAAVGGAAGGLIGALIGVGIPEYEAKLYEGKLRSGSVLVSVHAEHVDRVTTAKRLFEECGAEHIHATSEAHVSH